MVVLLVKKVATCPLHSNFYYLVYDCSQEMLLISIEFLFKSRKESRVIDYQNLESFMFFYMIFHKTKEVYRVLLLMGFLTMN